MKIKGLITMIYGVWLVCGGVLRFMEAGSNAALGFGLAMGILALAGGLFFFTNKSMLGTIITGISVIFVVGFFLSKTAKEGIDLRVAITLITSVAEIGVLCWPSRASE